MPIGILDIQYRSMKAEPLPTLEPSSDFYHLLECPVCLAYKPAAMIVHLDCLKLFCSGCIHALLHNRGSNCPWCRSSIWTDEDISMPKFGLPSPQDQFLMDSLEFKCPDCSGLFKIDEARKHPNQCKGNKRFRPAHIHNWENTESVTREAISNPRYLGSETPSTSSAANKDRLLVYHHEGNQIDSKFLRPNHTVDKIKTQIAHHADVDPNDLKIFKFEHHEITDMDTKVRDIAPPDRATYITSLIKNKWKNLAEHTAMLNLNDVGPNPRSQKKNK